jgi:hypothetical protein
LRCEVRWVAGVAIVATAATVVALGACTRPDCPLGGSGPGLFRQHFLAREITIPSAVSAEIVPGTYPKSKGTTRKDAFLSCDLKKNSFARFARANTNVQKACSHTDTRAWQSSKSFTTPPVFSALCLLTFLAKEQVSCTNRQYASRPHVAA